MSRRSDYLRYPAPYGRRRRKRNKLMRVIAVFILALGVGMAVFFVTDAKLGREAEAVPEPEGGVKLGEYRKLTDEEKAAEEAKAAKDNAEQLSQLGGYVELASAGPYGLWYTESVESEKVGKEVLDESIWMGDFVDNRTRTEAKGIYISVNYANGKWDEIMRLLEETEINTVVMDIKDDDGNITYLMENELVNETGRCVEVLRELPELLKRLKEKNVYTIARIVTMKDPVVGKKRPELVLHKKDGSLYKDNAGYTWMNPYIPEVWKYLEELSLECVKAGFDEINYDYIRFATDKGMSEVDFGEAGEEMTRIEVISGGIRSLCEVLKPLGVFVSCDVYGSVINSSVDAKIVGQSYREMSRYLDYICPMVYPSHYGDGCYKLDYPDLHPYELVLGAMGDSKKTLSTIAEDENKAIARPWLQDFTASWKSHHQKYGAKQVREQIDAVYDSGYGEWLLWNAGVNYTEDALLKE